MGNDLSGLPPARSFGTEAARYAATRPSYPADAIDFVLAETSRPGRILDLGAGTGKLTRSLIGRADEVIAVEPDPQMLAVLADEVPQARALDGHAERIPLPDGSVDAILAGQAFHWFARPQADREMARVLRPGGVVGLIWNFPDRGCEWVRELYRASQDDRKPDAAPLPNLDPKLFGAAEESWSDWTHPLPGPDALRDLVHTWSWVIGKPARERASVDQRLKLLVSRYAELQGPLIHFPHRTKAVRQRLH